VTSADTGATTGTHGDGASDETPETRDVPDATDSTDATDTRQLDEFGGAIGKGQVRTIRAPWGPSTVTRVRHAVVTDLRARDLAEQTIDEAEIVVSELMTNAIRHARPLADGCLRVRWKVRGEVVELEVTDGGGDTAPVPAPAAVWVSSGRGLRIIRSLAHEWGVGEDKGGQTVWAAVGGPRRRRAT
jgi:anti-sigma regulatory factor (Ser/Thr protein kinase)